MTDADILKLGWHVQLNNRRGKYDARLMDFRWAVVSVTCDASTTWWLADHAKAQPETRRFARYLPAEKFYKALWPTTTDARKLGQLWGQQLILAGLSREPYWRTDEWANDDQKIADFNLGALDVLLPAGYKVGCINYSMGNPKQPPWDQVDGWLVHKPVFEAINAAGPARVVALCNLYASGCDPDGSADAYLLRILHPMQLCYGWGLNNIWWGAGETGDDVPGLAHCPLSDSQKASNLFAINRIFQRMPMFFGGAVFSLDEISGDYYISDQVFNFVEAYARNMAGPVAFDSPTPAPAPAPAPGPDLRAPYPAVTTRSLNARLGNADGDPLVKTLPAGTPVTVLDDGSRRARVDIGVTVLRDGLKPQ